MAIFTCVVVWWKPTLSVVRTALGSVLKKTCYKFSQILSQWLKYVYLAWHSYIQYSSTMHFFCVWTISWSKNTCFFQATGQCNWKKAPQLEAKWFCHPPIVTSHSLKEGRSGFQNPEAEEVWLDPPNPPPQKTKPEQVFGRLGLVIHKLDSFWTLTVSPFSLQALVAAARVFLSKHRLEPSLNVSDRGIRLDLDSDSESEDGLHHRRVFHSPIFEGWSLFFYSPLFWKGRVSTGVLFPGFIGGRQRWTLNQDPRICVSESVRIQVFGRLGFVTLESTYKFGLLTLVLLAKDWSSIPTGHFLRDVPR